MNLNFAQKEKDVGAIVVDNLILKQILHTMLGRSIHSCMKLTIFVYYYSVQQRYTIAFDSLLMQDFYR